MINQDALKIIFILLIAPCSGGCSANSIMADQFKRGVNEYREDLSTKVLIHMDIETMFPDHNLRELARAAANGNIGKIDQLLAQGLNVNTKGTRNATVLFWALRNPDGFEYLLNRGADPNVVFDDGGSVMHWVARQENCNMLNTALLHGGDPNLRAGLFGGSPIFETVTAGKNTIIPNCLKLLLSKGADINLRDEQGKSVLLLSADLARFDIALYLLENGANPSLKDNKGRSIRDFLNSYGDAFEKGSATEKYWKQVDAWLKTNM